MKAICFIFGVIILCLGAYYFACRIYIQPSFLGKLNSGNPTDEAISTFATGIVSSVALAIAFITIFLQKQELEATIEELHAQKNELKHQNLIMQEQKFEQTFNALFVVYKQSLLGINGEIIENLSSENKSGGNYLSSILKKINRSLTSGNHVYLYNILLNLSPIFSQYFYLIAFVNNLEFPR